MRSRSPILLLAACAGVIAGGCGGEGGAQPASHVDPAPPSDTVATDIQRVWSSESVDLLGSIGPRGERFAFTSWDSGDLRIRRLGSGATRTLVENPAPYEKGFALQPVISPTGDQVAFSWHDTDSDQWSIATADTSGANALEIIRETDRVPHLLGWSPDGSRLYAWQASGTGSVVYSVSMEGGSVRALDSLSFRPEDPALSPEGRYLAVGRPESWSSPDDDIRILDLETSHEVAAISDPGHQVPLDWSPDGGYLLFLTDRGGMPEAGRIKMSQGQPEGEATLVRRDFSNVSPIGFDSRGRFFYGLSVETRSLFHSRLDSTGTRVVAPIERVTGDATRMAWGGAWSPEGDMYAYSFLPTGGGPGRSEVRLFSRAQDRAAVVRMKNALNFGRPRAWISKDEILVSATDSAGRKGLWTISVHDGSTRLLFPWPEARGAEGTARGAWAVAPSKELVAWAEYTGGQDGGETTVRIRLSSYSDSASESPRTLRTFSVPGHVSRPVLEMGFGPRAERLYSWEREADSVRLRRTRVSPGDPSPETVLALPEGSRPAGLEAGPDGAMLWYSQQKNPGSGAAEDIRQIVAVDLSDGRTEPVGVEGINLRSVSVGPAGKNLIFARGLPQHELWVLTGALPE